MSIIRTLPNGNSGTWKVEIKCTCIGNFLCMSLYSKFNVRTSIYVKIMYVQYTETL